MSNLMKSIRGIGLKLFNLSRISKKSQILKVVLIFKKLTRIASENYYKILRINQNTIFKKSIKSMRIIEKRFIISKIQMRNAYSIKKMLKMPSRTKERLAESSREWASRMRLWSRDSPLIRKVSFQPLIIRTQFWRRAKLQQVGTMPYPTYLPRVILQGSSVTLALCKWSTTSRVPLAPLVQKTVKASAWRSKSCQRCVTTFIRTNLASMVGSEECSV